LIDAPRALPFGAGANVGSGATLCARPAILVDRHENVSWRLAWFEFARGPGLSLRDGLNARRGFRRPKGKRQLKVLPVCRPCLFVVTNFLPAFRREKHRLGVTRRTKRRLEVILGSHHVPALGEVPALPHQRFRGSASVGRVRVDTPREGQHRARKHQERPAPIEEHPASRIAWRDSNRWAANKMEQARLLRRVPQSALAEAALPWPAASRTDGAPSSRYTSTGRPRRMRLQMARPTSPGRAARIPSKAGSFPPM
jgi:hypothetical protein